MSRALVFLRRTGLVVVFAYFCLVCSFLRASFASSLVLRACFRTILFSSDFVVAYFGCARARDAVAEAANAART